MNDRGKLPEITKKQEIFWSLVFIVEMAGIEPASERLDHQISTSVVKLFDLTGCTLIHFAYSQPAAWTRKSSFLKSATSVRAHQHCDA